MTRYTLYTTRYPLPAIRYALYLLLAACHLSLLASCASPKAHIDNSAMRQIIWPGPPEKPRIQYLWSINQLSTAIEEKRKGLLDLILGEVSKDVSDPRASNVLIKPFSIFVDSKDKLYVTDLGAYRVTVIDLKTLNVINIYGIKGGEFQSPVGVVVNPMGHIYISDSMLRKVFVFDEKGKYLFQFEGDFLRPTCMAIDPKSSRIYLSDTLQHKIYIYSLDGKQIGSIGKPGSLLGELNFPTHLFVDKDGFLYVTDAMNFRIQIFDQGGRAVGSIGSIGDTYGSLDKPKGVSVDTYGNIYIVDSIKDTVKIFDRNGNLLLFFGDKGQGYGNLYLPSGIFIDQKNYIYVADTYNMRIQAFQFIGGE